MLTIKPQALSVSSRPVPKPAGRVVLVVTCMAGFEMIGSQPTLCSDQTLWKTLSKLLPKKTAPDFGLEKPFSEWLAFGHVYPKDKLAVSAEAEVKVTRGDKVLSRKRLHVSGARHWKKVLNTAWPSEPVAIGGPVALDWSLAFGGAGHDVNPNGQGLYGDAWAYKMLPQIEDRDNLIASPSDAPAPAGLGPLPLNAPARFKPYGTYDSKWQEVDYPAMASDTPPEVLMLAAADQHVPEAFQAGDVFTCEGLSREGRVKSWTLPAWQARCFIRRALSGSALIPIPMKLDTVWLMPESGLLGQMWRGVIEISEADASDVNLLLAGLEDSASPKGIAHYAEVLATRSGTKRDAAISSLDESPLLPEGQVGSLLLLMPPETKKRIAAIVDEAKAKALERIDHANVLAPSANLKIPGQAAAPAPGATTQQPVLPSPADEAAVISEQMVEILTSAKPDAVKLALLVKRAQELGLEARKVASAKVKAAMDVMGIDIEAKAAKKVEDALAGPPVRKMQGMLTRLQENVRTGSMSGTQFDQLRPKLAQALQASVARYRKTAHWMPVASSLIEPKLLGQRIAEWVAQGSSGSPAAGCDWVGADLSGYNLDGANLSGAFLDGVSFAGASLVGADLHDATFAGADFSDANLSKANLSGANLGKATLMRTNLQEANLTRAVLDQARLDGANLRDAKLEGAVLIGINFGRADISGANFKKAKVLGLKTGPDMDAEKLLTGKLPTIKSMLNPIDISQVTAVGASMEKATLIGLAGKNANFSKVNFLNASFAHCQLTGTNFSYANFTSTSVVLDSSLPNSNFENATLMSSFFNAVDLRSSNMRYANLNKSYFGAANMSNVDASFAKASSARFDRTDLTQATFANAQLTGALMMGANIKGATFDYSNLTHCDFTKADFDSRTSFVKAIQNQTKMPKAKKAD